MEYAFDILTGKLKTTGMNQTEIDHLLASFLEEEAFQYVEYISSHLMELSQEIDADVLLS